MLSIRRPSGACWGPLVALSTAQTSHSSRRQALIKSQKSFSINDRINRTKIAEDLVKIIDAEQAFTILFGVLTRKSSAKRDPLQKNVKIV
jgi:hypothetical protein